MKSVALLLVLCLFRVESLRICSFNVQVFGEAKASKQEVTDVLRKIISRCDIMLLMEIRDSKDKAIHSLMARLNSQASIQHEYSLIISKRLGRSMSKEQYAFIYRKNLVDVKESYQYEDQQPGDMDVFSREPFIVWFSVPSTAIRHCALKAARSESFLLHKRCIEGMNRTLIPGSSKTSEVKDFVIIPHHTVPEDAVREIDELYDVYLDIRHKWNTENIIFMGDFNAGCSYVPKKHWKNIRLRTNPEFSWLIGDNVDTTVKRSTKCAYDRIVLHGNKLISSVVPDSGTVFDFMQQYGLTEEQALEVSDHYPVEFQLKEITFSPRRRKPRRG